MTNQQKIASAISIAAVLATIALVRRKNSTPEQTQSSHLPTTYPSASTPNPAGKTVGYRNNNPLNIIYTGTVWQGEIRPSTDTTNPKKAQFVSMPYGYRAAMVTIKNYGAKYGLHTIADICGRWDGSAGHYAQVISNLTGWPTNKVIDPNSKSDMVTLVTAMSKMENGSNVPVPTEAIQEGWKLYNA